MGEIAASFWERHIHNLISEREEWIQNWTWRVCETRMPSAATVQIWKVLHFDPTPTQGHVMSVNYEQPFDELTVQVWLFYDHPNFKHL